MGRVKIKFPDENPLFTTEIAIRISDVNYGGHMGNDSLLSILHEARVRLLAAHGYTEMNAAGAGLIMADVEIAYKSEAFYAEQLRIDIYADELTTVSFSLLYRVSADRQGSAADVAHARTGMVCFDYSARKVMPIPAPLKLLLN